MILKTFFLESELKTLKLSAFIIFTSLTMSGCVSIDYENKRDQEILRSTLKQTSERHKKAADSLIEGKVHFIQNFATNSAVKMRSSAEVTDSASLMNEWKSAKTSIGLKTKANGVCTIHFSGPMTKQAETAFYEVAKFALSQRCDDVLLKLYSSGGLIEVGVGIGLTAHKLGWKTMAWNPGNSRQACISSCAIAYLGGKTRYYWNPTLIPTDIGFPFFHQASREINGKKVCITDPKDQVYSIIKSYLNIVFPEDPLLMMSKIVTISCAESNVISRREQLRDYFRDTYTTTVYEKYR